MADGSPTMLGGLIGLLGGSAATTVVESEKTPVPTAFLALYLKM